VLDPIADTACIEKWDWPQVLWSLGLCSRHSERGKGTLRYASFVHILWLDLVFSFFCSMKHFFPWI
jgi:hypothetical protein